jgi:hypothetical protein
MYQQKIVVEGGGSFPLDMLRYDGCYPAKELGADNSDDTGGAHQMERTIRYETEGKQRFTLHRWVEYKNQPPTFARWESFGWKVVEWGPTGRHS